MGHVAEAIEDGRRALDLARQIGIGGLEATALASLSLSVWSDGDRDGALRLARQALAIAEEFAGSLQRGLSQIVTGVLTEAGVSRSGRTADGEALARLSPRERELVTLVARGHTDAQIAAQLYITVRTVSSHLDRVRDKTGCRRRADLTRLALSAGLV